MRSSLLFLALAVGCGGSSAGTSDGSIDGPGGGGDAIDLDADVPPDGPPISSCPVGTYCDETAPIPPTTLLFAVHALSTADVFAVGDGGTIVRRRNNAWGAMQSGTSHNLRGVWAISSTNVWAVGEAGTVLHFDGTVWSPVTGVATTDLNGVWASGANDVWAVGLGEVHHWNGSAWGTTPLAGTLFAVTGTSPTDVWVSGESAKAKHFDGNTWTTVDPGVGVDVYTVKAISATNVWVAGLSSTKETANLAGTTWATHATSGTIFQSLHAFAANDVWGVGGTKVGHWNGSAWTSATPTGNTSSLWGISGAGNELFIVGSGATIIHHN